jgi:hypothetical protein
MNNLWRVQKTYQGGKAVYYFRSKKKLNDGQMECALQWVGEHTIGGHCYGYTVTARKSQRKTIPREQLLTVPVSNF